LTAPALPFDAIGRSTPLRPTHKDYSMNNAIIGSLGFLVIAISLAPDVSSASTRHLDDRSVSVSKAPAHQIDRNYLEEALSLEDAHMHEHFNFGDITHHNDVDTTSVPGTGKQKASAFVV
jgi:hypothetical protein